MSRFALIRDRKVSKMIANKAAAAHRREHLQQAALARRQAADLEQQINEGNVYPEHIEAARTQVDRWIAYAMENENVSCVSERSHA